VQLKDHGSMDRGDQNNDRINTIDDHVETQNGEDEDRRSNHQTLTQLKGSFSRRSIDCGARLGRQG
jgi:hypothetical protein